MCNKIEIKGSTYPANKINFYTREVVGHKRKGWERFITSSFTRFNKFKFREVQQFEGIRLLLEFLKCSQASSTLRDVLASIFSFHFKQNLVLAVVEGMNCLLNFQLKGLIVVACDHLFGLLSR